MVHFLLVRKLDWACTVEELRGCSIVGGVVVVELDTLELVGLGT